MRKRWQRKRRIYLLRLFLVVECGSLLTACGDKSADNDVADSAVEEEAPFQKSEEKASRASEFEREVPEQPEPNPGITDKDEESQETADFAEDNEKRFYECAEKLKIDRTEADSRYQRLCDDDVFQSQTARFTSMDIEDLDQNGQSDMVVMIQEDEYYYYGGAVSIFI